jgi:hypothetical protein
VATLTIGMAPSITQQPSNLVVVQGQNVTFSVAATGDTPLGYQWRFNGTPLGNATSSSYTVAAATVANVGNYDVMVSDTYGTTASAKAVLRVLVPPTITSIQASGTLISVSIVSLSGLNYRFEYKNSLNDAAWMADSV